MSRYTQEQLDNFTPEELEQFSDSQLKNLTIDGLKMFLDLRKSVKKDEEEAQKFWKKEYPRMKDDEKAKYWSGLLFRSMRSQEESGLNPYSIYTELALKDALKQEPRFIELLPLIYRTWGGMFDADKADKAIQKCLKNISK